MRASQERRRGGRADLRRDRRAVARSPTSSSATTCSRCCCSPATRTARPMTDAELRDELVTLLVAGHETTATGLAWTFDLLLHDPRGARAPAAPRGAGRRGLPRRGRQGVAAPAAGRPGVGAWCAASRSARRLPIPPGIEINPSIVTIHRRADRYPEPALPARALPRRRRAGHVHVDPVRRRDAALPGRELRPLRDADRGAPGGGAHRAARPTAGEAAAQGRHARARRGVRVTQARAPQPASAADLALAQPAPSQ